MKKVMFRNDPSGRNMSWRICLSFVLLKLSLESHNQTMPVGVISSILDNKVISEGSEKHNALIEGSLLWITQSRSPLGIVDEIFGPVKSPYYVIRYTDEEVPTGISVGADVSFVPEFTENILNNKDAREEKKLQNQEEGFSDMGQVPSLTADMSMNGSSVISKTLQPLHFFPPQKQKRCAIHCYIAQTIHYNQQTVRWSPAAADTPPIYGAKPCNLNVMLQSKTALLYNLLQGSSHGRILGQLQVKASPAIATYVGLSNEKSTKIVAMNNTFEYVYHEKWSGSDIAIKRINDMKYQGPVLENLVKTIWDPGIYIQITTVLNSSASDPLASNSVTLPNGQKVPGPYEYYPDVEIPFQRFSSTHSDTSKVEAPPIDKNMTIRPPSSPSGPAIWPYVHKSRASHLLPIPPNLKHLNCLFSFMEVNKPRVNQGPKSSVFLPQQQFDAAGRKFLGKSLEAHGGYVPHVPQLSFHIRYRLSPLSTYRCKNRDLSRVQFCQIHYLLWPLLNLPPLSGAKVKSIKILPPNFLVPFDELESAVSKNTCAILINTHNPTGKMFTQDKLETIASLIIENNVLAFCDEVYAKWAFEANRISLVFPPGMYGRTVTLNSLGKTFSLTEWKIGWRLALVHWTWSVNQALSYLTFMTSTPMQWEAPDSLRTLDTYFEELLQMTDSQLLDIALFCNRFLNFDLSNEVLDGGDDCAKEKPIMIWDPGIKFPIKERWQYGRCHLGAM